MAAQAGLCLIFQKSSKTGLYRVQSQSPSSHERVQLARSTAWSHSFCEKWTFTDFKLQYVIRFLSDYHWLGCQG